MKSEKEQVLAHAEKALRLLEDENVQRVYAKVELRAIILLLKGASK